MELISIIVPVYNVEDYLEDCIDSCLGQTYENIEVLLIDDGSTDDSARICLRYEKESNKVRYFRKENGGLSDARNYGMTKMAGEYFTFVDSDDLLPKDFIERLYQAITTYKTKLAMCDFVRMVGNQIDAGSLALEGCYSREDIIINCFKGVLAHSACAKLYHKDIAEELQFPLGKYFEDEYALYDIFIKYDTCVTNKTKYIYRKREGSITQNSKIDKQNDDLMEALEHVETIINNEAGDISYALDFKVLQDCMVIIKKDIKLSRRTTTSDKAANKIKKLSAANLEKVGTGKSFFTQYKMIKACYPAYRLLFRLMFKLHLNTEA